MAITNESEWRGNPIPAVWRPLPWRLIGLDYAYFNQLRTIAPIANALEAGKPLFCGLDRPLAAPGRADDDRALTGPHNDIEPSEFVLKTYPVNRSEFNLIQAGSDAFRNRFIASFARLTWPSAFSRISVRRGGIAAGVGAISESRRAADTRPNSDLGRQGRGQTVPRR